MGELASLPSQQASLRCLNGHRRIMAPVHTLHRRVRGCRTGCTAAHGSAWMRGPHLTGFWRRHRRSCSRQPYCGGLQVGAVAAARAGRHQPGHFAPRSSPAAGAIMTAGSHGVPPEACPPARAGRGTAHDTDAGHDVRARRLSRSWTSARRLTASAAAATFHQPGGNVILCREDLLASAAGGLGGSPIHGPRGGETAEGNPRHAPYSPGSIQPPGFARQPAAGAAAHETAAIPGLCEVRADGDQPGAIHSTWRIGWIQPVDPRVTSRPALLCSFSGDCRRGIEDEDDGHRATRVRSLPERGGLRCDSNSPVEPARLRSVLECNCATEPHR